MMGVRKMHSKRVVRRMHLTAGGLMRSTMDVRKGSPTRGPLALMR